VIQVTTAPPPLVRGRRRSRSGRRRSPEDTTGHKAYRTDLEYNYTQVMSTPVVIRLHAADAAPAVVFNTFAPNQGNVVESQGVMRAVHGIDGSPIWTAPTDMWNHMDHSVDGNASIAARDCMGTGEVCFVTGGWDPNDTYADSTKSHQHGGLIAFGSDGRFLWLNRAAQVWWGAPAIANFAKHGRSWASGQTIRTRRSWSSATPPCASRTGPAAFS
jgi:hypothetical protein